MAAEIDRWFEVYVTEISEEKYAYHQITHRCINHGYCIFK